MLRCAAFAFVLLVPAYAAAQPCEGQDALSAVQRTRDAVDAVADANGELDRDLRRLRRAEDSIDDPGIVQVSVLARDSTIHTLATCDAHGGAGPKASFRRRQGGLVVGYDRDLWGLRGHVLMQDSSLVASLPKASSARAEDGEEEDDDAELGLGQTMIGGSLRLSRWVRAELDLIVSRPLRSSPSASTGIEISASGVAVEDAPDRVHGSVSVPALGVSSTVLTRLDGGIDLASASLGGVPLGMTPLHLSAGMTYLADERETVTGGGLAYRSWFWEGPHDETYLERLLRGPEATGAFVQASLDASAEHGTGRLRHTRARAEVNGMGFIGGHEAGYVVMNAFAELTTFGSGALARQTGRDGHRVGGGVGARLGGGGRHFALHLEGYVGGNRPDTLARVKQAEGRLETRGFIWVRFGGGRKPTPRTPG
jgi:hypothetical protein